MIAARTVLVVAAHPDDEALGCGGTIARLSSEGSKVHLLFVADGVNARGSAEGAVRQRRAMAEKAAAALGTSMPTYLDFPDNRLDSVDLLDLIQAVEQHAATIRPDLVFTHSPSDLNIDHRICAQAVMTAFRPTPGQGVRSIVAFEVPSSTEWSFGATPTAFEPNAFFDVSGHIEMKIEALRQYEEEMRPFPHPRSIEAVEALARWRGATIGVAAAEAFMILRTVQ